MPIKRGHVAPQNTYIVTLIRSFDSQCDPFLVANAMFSTKPIIYCSESLSDLLGYSKAQLMLKSSKLDILYGPLTSLHSIHALHLALSGSTEAVVSISLYAKNATNMSFKITITPVRDVDGQIPLYLLFFHRDSGRVTHHGHETKRSSLRSKLHKKSLRVNRNADEESKLPKSSTLIDLNSHHACHFVDTAPTHRTVTGIPSGQPQSVSMCFPIKIACNTYGDESDADNINDVISPSNSLIPVNVVDETLDHQPQPIMRQQVYRSTGLDSSNSSSFQRRNKANTWYGTRNTSNDERDDSGKPKKITSRPYSCRIGNHFNTTDSEALLLVLSSHAEPTKSSVTEKFAQFLSMDEDLHVEHRFQSPRMHRFTLKHYGMFKAVWDWIILGLILYTAIFTPYTAVFGTNNENKYAKVGSLLSGSSMNTEYLYFADIIVDVMFVVDIVINFRTTYVNKNDEVVSHPRRIATHYIKGWFFIDLIAAIPFDVFFWRSQGEQPTAMTNMLKAARLLRLVGIFRKLDRYSQYGASILLLLTALFALIAHWLACIWYAIGNNEQHHSILKIGWLSTLANQTKKYYSDEADSGPDMATKYITALYFTFSSLTSIGFGNVSPNTDAEKIFSIVVMLVGSLMYASIFGNVGALIQRLYSGTARYHAQMLRIKEFIRFHQIPSPLRQRLEEYSTQVWEHTNGIDMTMVQYSFPESLQSDISLFVYRDFLGGSPAFKSLNDGCLRNLSMRIRASHMPPSDTLIHVGDLLTAVYYVVKGSLEVVTTDDVIVGVLNPGDIFGGLPPLAHLCQHHYHNDSQQDQSMADTFQRQNQNCYRSLPQTLGSHPSLASLHAVGLLQSCPTPKCRFAVRALTYTDVQFIDRHDLADLCAVYAELPLRLLQQFELTMPLVSSSSSTTSLRSATAAQNYPIFHHSISHQRPISYKSSLSAFLKAASVWNVVPKSVLVDVIPVNPKARLTGSMLDEEANFKDICSPNRPQWELERLHRLFEHGGLSISSDNTIPPPPLPIHQVDGYTSLATKPIIADRPDASLIDAFDAGATSVSGMRQMSSPDSLCFHRQHRLQTLVSPCNVNLSAERLMIESDERLLNCLLNRVSRVERHLSDLETRMSATIDVIQMELVHLLYTPLNSSPCEQSS